MNYIISSISLVKLGTGGGKMDKWLTRRETCRILGISMATLSRYMASGRITYYKTSPYRSAKVKFKQSDVLALLNSFKHN